MRAEKQDAEHHEMTTEPNAVETETLTLGMGCFWGPEALFGYLAGVLHTRTGYAGGTTQSPVYRQLGDHSETIEIVFDPSIITLEQLLELFWNHHNPAVINDYKGRQYRSLLFYRNEQQRHMMEQMQQPAAPPHAFSINNGNGANTSGSSDTSSPIAPDVPEKKRLTEIQPYDAWYPAEERHQKYYLQRQHELMDQLGELYPDREELFRSTLAARLNGYSRGHVTLAEIRQELGCWRMPVEQQRKINDWLADRL
ncbi:peptide-methionine (S)-S-oxide reductase MsrA [Paenibacillus wulumuqiensis]|uniref:peptide-methionine (S)-S-oxide reductase MsrA n=1 Tax=Paenibacillus wulumuqiensis TaxID=1567107 RepID=UPI000B069D88|nr:peptide-methionine (S)-S-oxide reductase [Paenibacillus wulumuqiensis]